MPGLLRLVNSMVVLIGCQNVRPYDEAACSHCIQASFEAAKRQPVHHKDPSQRPVEVLPGAFC